MVEIGFTQGPQKLDGSRKTNYPGTIDRGFTVFVYYFYLQICTLYINDNTCLISDYLKFPCIMSADEVQSTISAGKYQMGCHCFFFSMK
jgi:hypothetical protein